MNNFSMLGHWNGDKFTYELQIEEDNHVMMFPFKSPLPLQKVQTLQDANAVECPCKEMGDIEGVSRLYGEFSEPIEREKAFINFEGVTKSGDVYKVLEKGQVDIIKTEMGTTLNFESDLIKGRWLLRTLPNIFNKEFISGDNMQLLWKPGTSTLMSDPMEQIGDPTKIHSEIISVVTEMEGNSFNTVVAATGRFVDRFGQPFIYTKDFLKTLYTNMKRQMDEGNNPIGVDAHHTKIDDGKMTELHLLEEGQQSKIVGRGIYNGDMAGTTGASIDAEFDVFWDRKAKAYIPVNGVTKRVSLVASPACKVCKFIPK
jgi:hypothetical protein